MLTGSLKQTFIFPSGVPPSVSVLQPIASLHVIYTASKNKLNGMCASNQSCVFYVDILGTVGMIFLSFSFLGEEKL